MYGAILGDIIGSRFEFDRGGWTKDFELFTPKCGFTDDTVMTVAVAEAMDCGLPSSSVHGIVQTRLLEWAAVSSSRGYF